VKRSAPCVLVLDEVNAIAPAGAMPGSLESRLALQLADGIQRLRSEAVFVLATCREPAMVHTALRRSGRLHHALTIPAPSPVQRADILENIADKLLPSSCEGQHEREQMRLVVRAVGTDAHGLCGAQLRGLCQHAAMAAWRRCADSGEGNRTAASPTKEEWWAALDSARSVALSALRLPSPSSSAPPMASRNGRAESDTKSDAPGASHTVVPAASACALEELRLMPSGDALLGALIMPLRSPKLFSRLGVRAPRGVLLYGEAGSGKTTLARHVAAAAAANFVEVHAAQLVSSTIGASEAALARLFASARAAAPCILFLDGLDSLAPPRGADMSTEGTMDRLLSLLLVELDGAVQWEGPPVVLLGATRDRKLLDPAILRPGRLDVHVHVQRPGSAQRERLLARMLARMPVAMEQLVPSTEAGTAEQTVSLGWLAERTAGYTLAQLSAMCREAAMGALREGMGAERVEKRHFEMALATDAASTGSVATPATRPQHVQSRARVA
jgi:SpoVK/Ycf46/Vps4 family AAA+-type ATPase